MNAQTTQLPLADRFSVQRGAFATRASAIFPVVVRPGADTLIVFMDYWRLKNRVEAISCFVRVYDGEGSLAARHSHAITAMHNEISIAALLGSEHFDGMAEVEFVSTQNLTFNYPAVVAFYRSGEFYSAVHAPGRIRNPDEPRQPARSTETNWTCKVGDGVTPFFHVFNGPRAGAFDACTVSLRDRSGAVIASRTSDFGLHNAFSSRMVKLDELFDLSGLPEGGFFVTLDVPDDDCFPRLVVGNYHRDIDFVEATHSFYWSRVGDILDRDAEGRPDLLSFIPSPNIPDLDLELVFYPTNSEGEVSARLRSAGHSQPLADSGQSVSWKTGGPGAEVWRYRVDPGVSLLSFDFVDGRVPSRLNTSYRYSVRGGEGRFSTDIATGAHAHVYPPKFSHWGHGLVSDDFDTVLMIRNISHNRSSAKAARATLRVFDGSGAETSHALEVPSECAHFVNLRDLTGGGAGVRTLSWFLRSECPDLEAFWICHSRSGSICGEHAF